MGSLVSIVLPTYNRAFCVGVAIDSALGQTHQNVEILLIDDGSTDNTRELIQQRYGSDPRLRYVYQENAGVSAARNHALRLAQGEYIAFLDSDDLWKPWKLEVQLACLARVPEAGLIWSDMEAIGPEGQLVNPAYLRTMYRSYRWFDREQLFQGRMPLKEVVPSLPELVGDRCLWWGDIYSQMATGNLVHTSTVLDRRERIEKVGGFNLDLRLAGGDYEFHLRTCREGPVAYCDLSTTVYQLGQADRLTRFCRRIADNYLKTLTATLERDRDRIQLPAGLLSEVQADANSWAGYEAFREGDHGAARKLLFNSLRFKPWQPQVARWLALACLPAPVAKALRGVRARLGSRPAETRPPVVSDVGV